MYLRRILVFSLTLAFGAVAYGQQTQTPAPDNSSQGEGMRHQGRSHERMRGGGGDGLGEFRGMRELNLTDEQRAIFQRHFDSVKPQREELFKLGQKRGEGSLSADDAARAKALRQEIHNSMQSAHDEIESTLTPEQRAKLDQLKAEHKARRDEMMKRRQGRLENTPQ